MKAYEEVITRRVVLPDGRYLIYYTFGAVETSTSSQPASAKRESEAEMRDKET